MLYKSLSFFFGLSLVSSTIYYQETFETDPFADNRWQVSQWKQDTGEAGQWEWASELWSGNPDRKGLKTTEDARFYAATSKLQTNFDNTDSTLVFGVRVKHEQKMDCGGGYVKLLPSNVDVTAFNGDTDYSIMFGPDICGYSTKKVHTIFNFNGENLEKKEEVKCPDDDLTHTYILIVNPDDTYEIRVDDQEPISGNLKDGWDFEKPKLINDPAASKPSDWVDEKMIDDPNDEKPEDWDNEPETITDPDASKPDDWDEEEDGEWEAPMIPNPNFKGEWKAQKIENPDYQGPWVHPQIPNPDYKEESNVYKRGELGYVGIEVWQVKSGTLFNDFILADNVNEVEQFFQTRSLGDESSAKEAYNKANAPPEEDDDDDEEEEHDEL